MRRNGICGVNGMARVARTGPFSITPRENKNVMGSSHRPQPLCIVSNEKERSTLIVGDGGRRGRKGEQWLVRWTRATRHAAARTSMIAIATEPSEQRSNGGTPRASGREDIFGHQPPMHKHGWKSQEDGDGGGKAR
jgi:hypothetical protein